MNQPPILNIQLGVQGAQLVLNALAKLPYEQVADLINVIQSQAQRQLNPPPAESTTVSATTTEGDPQ